MAVDAKRRRPLPSRCREPPLRDIKLGGLPRDTDTEEPR